MLPSLKVILDIQELDMKMIRLMRIKKERKKELDQIDKLRSELGEQVLEKKKEVEEFAKIIQGLEEKIQETTGKVKKLEGQQINVKKVDEFNALTQEITSAERERIALEQKVSDLLDKKVAEEEILTKIQSSLAESEKSSLALQDEIRKTIELINEEGATLLNERNQLVKTADPYTLQVYERLLRNKRDRVIVPIENRSCSGCHIALTAQHENVVRKSENLVFCEHCSRIHYWLESEEPSAREAGGAPKRRRRRIVNA